IDVIERPVCPARFRIGNPPNDGNDCARQKDNGRYRLPTNCLKLKSRIGRCFSCGPLRRWCCQTSVVFPLSHSYCLPFGPFVPLIPILKLSDLRLPNRGGRWT